MKQALALEIMLNGENVFLTGAAGSGKTYTLNQFINIARSMGKKISVTATTGLAATHLNGNTIHAWSGLGIHDYITPKFIDKMSKVRQETIKKTDILIIDEISMLHDFRLDMVDDVCRRIRQQEDQPFGGIQIVLCGDFFQLPPINKGINRVGNFVTHSNVWREANFTICYLEENYRQKSDELIDILNAIREGDVRRRHAEALLSRLNSDDLPLDLEDITELHTTNIDVDIINESKLADISEKEFTYQQTTTGAKNYVTTLQKSVLAPEFLRLKKGALVMAVRNSQNHQYVNGSIGEVIDFEKYSEYPIVAFKNGKTLTVAPESWELRDGDKKRASITQIPLRLAYAITIHKSQGMTLDSAKINLQKAFSEGMGYVALSRVKALDKIYLIGINKKALLVSDEASRIDKVLKQKSLEAEKKFLYLNEIAEKRAKGVTIEENNYNKQNKSVTSWKEKLENMRKQFPNAYRPWKSSDDAELKRLFKTGNNIEYISTQLGRHPNSIKMRLQKHFGDDII